MVTASTTPSVLQPDPKKIRLIERATTLDQQMFESTHWLERALRLCRRQFSSYFWSAPPRWRVALRMLNPRQRATPTFASLGAPRSGTTLLSDYIMQHPCVVLPLAKEVEAALPTWKYCSAQFPTLHRMQQAERRFGTAMTGYCTPAIPSLLFPYAISAFARKLKIILLLRNPVERTFSHWRWAMLHTENWRRNRLWANFPDFAEAMRIELDTLESKGTSGFCPVGCGGFIQYSVYLPFLELLFRFYDRDDAMFINSETFFADPPGVAKRIYQFLELPEYEPVEMAVRNAGPAGRMDPETRQMLVEFFAPLNQELYDYVGCDFGWT